jgi:hypothetical protein
MYIRARQLAGCKRTGLLPAWAHKGGVLQDADTVATGGCRTPPGAWALVESHCQVNNVGTHTDACLTCVDLRAVMSRRRVWERGKRSVLGAARRVHPASTALPQGGRVD